MSVGVAIVGCGSIGQKRARALGRARLVACADVRPDRAEALARVTDSSGVRSPESGVRILAAEG